jgi:hypothetical protein
VTLWNIVMNLAVGLSGGKPEDYEYLEFVFIAEARQPARSGAHCRLVEARSAFYERRLPYAYDL